ncbi:MAG: hypothetical protein WD077_11305 [Bacteroidia bacterium]
MEKPNDNLNKIIFALENKAGTKQFIYRKTLESFEQLKKCSAHYAETLSGILSKKDSSVEISYQDHGMFESSLKFSGDMLYFMMHSNVFTFPSEHFVHNSAYVKEDPLRSYCGMIMVYNFLADSLKYHRYHDLGYLIGRIFINKDGHFFVQGQRQLSFLFGDFANQLITKENIDKIVETAILHTLDFDLYVPPFDKIKEITLLQKIKESGNAAISTGKRLGFTFGDSENETS